MPWRATREDEDQAAAGIKPDFRLPADSLLPGQIPTQEARRSTEPKTSMSSPISTNSMAAPIPVQVQTPAVAPNDFEAVRCVIASDSKRGAGFQNRENTAEAFGYSITLGDGTRLGFLRLNAGLRMGGLKISVWPTRLLGARLGVSDEDFGFAFEKFSSLFEQDAASGKVTSEYPIGKH